MSHPEPPDEGDASWIEADVLEAVAADADRLGEARLVAVLLVLLVLQTAYAESSPTSSTNGRASWTVVRLAHLPVGAGAAQEGRV
jgi:hypothetical protein